MKKLRFLCLVLAVILIIPAFASCGGKEKFQATVTVAFRVPVDTSLTEREIAQKIKDGEKEEDLYEYKLEPYELTVEGTAEELNILTAVNKALSKFEIEYKLSDDNTYVADVFGYKQADSVDSENGYYSYWACTVNGEASKDGRQSVTTIYDGDDIVFTWTSSSEARQDTGVAETTDPNDDVTSEIPTNETTAEEETEEDNA